MSCVMSLLLLDACSSAMAQDDAIISTPWCSLFSIVVLKKDELCSCQPDGIPLTLKGKLALGDLCVFEFMINLHIWLSCSCAVLYIN
jgi:hypothetical protein